MSKKPTVLMILDGYGLRDEKKGNGIAEANTPAMTKSNFQPFGQQI